MSAAQLTLLTTYGQELLTACREQLASLPVTRFGPVNASGRTSAALRAQVSETPSGYRLQLFAPSSILTLVYGRRPGKFPNLIAIEQWIVDKGIVPRPDKNGKSVSTKSLAYMIGRAMKEKGNTVYQQGPPSKLFADILNAANVSAAVKSFIVPLLVQDVRSQIHLALAA